MVREVVEYRLHRYLMSQAARRVGEVRKPIDRGTEVDATFTVETTGTTPTSVVIEFAGGTADTDTARNTEYVRGFDLVLHRLSGIGADLVDAYIDTGITAGLAVADRRLDPGEGLSHPVPLAAGVDLVVTVHRVDSVGLSSTNPVTARGYRRPQFSYDESLLQYEHAQGAAAGLDRHRTT